MKLSPAVMAGSLAVRQGIDYNAPPPNLSTLPDRSLFDTWRPKAHVLPPTGHIGDPCMHYADPETGLFHVGWLHLGAAGATTDDLVTYRDVNPEGLPFIVEGGKNDPLAVFDGSVIPSGIDGKPTLLYTSVSYLPIHFTIPYTRGSETQSLAVSRDGGRTFAKLEQGPVISGPPFAANVTAFRDPYVFQSSKLDAELGSAPGTWYVVISGGIHGDGPSQFLYRQHDPEFQYWEELGQWWHEPANTTWGNGNWAGRWGFNFEVGNVFSLDEQGYNVEGEIFTTLGVEWSPEPIVPQFTQFHDMLWAAGNISTSENGTVKFQPTMAGKFDWGRSAYAAAGKELPATSKASQKSGAPDRFLSYLWLTGDFYGTLPFPTNQQNWTGALLLPRELSVGKIRNVVDNELVRETASWRVVSTNQSGVVELVTLKQEIAREALAALTSNASTTATIEPGRTLSEPGVVPFQKVPDSKFYVITATLSFPKGSRGSDLRAGFQILSSDYESTTIYYQFSNESIVVDRSNSSAAAKTTDGIDTTNEAGRLRLFDLAQDGSDGQQDQIESLKLTIVVDNAIVEVHANERFGLGTWVRSWYAASREIRFFHDGNGEVTFGDVTVHEGLYDAWPERNGSN
ncbi:glycoside hydrolase family 32 protein [Daldinia caldariorum]|uniref:glycoside hydrolase family 32 protein n=1 Tax=Daldinia caldariorum TaxID=326644 RepID=UPI0020073BDE|nr:glycoside hydrolase family 32 protein [Daldinia caldariorum]KAI1469266.1 glycoside hydrolase family 32 protein [Daldinia caldariorum]